MTVITLGRDQHHPPLLQGAGKVILRSASLLNCGWASPGRYPGARAAGIRLIALQALKRSIGR